jgi:ABC-type multidrug transport system fused ATPase/permease subunit
VQVRIHHHPHLQVDPSFTAKSRSTWEILRRISRYLLPYKKLAAATVACAILSMGFSLIYPKLAQFVIDDLISHKRADRLTWVMLALLAAFLLRDLFNGLRIWVNNTFEQNVIFDLRRQVYARVQRLPVDYFEQRASGDLMTRVVEDVNSVERVLIDGTEQGSVAVLTIMGVAVILFATNPKLAAVALIPIPLLSVGAVWYTITAHRRYRIQREAASALNAFADGQPPGRAPNQSLRA